MNVCIAYPNRQLTFSETFIKNQLNQIKHNYYLTGGYYPYLSNDGSIFVGALRLNIVRVFIKFFFPALYHHLYSMALAKFLIKKNISIVLAQYGPTAGCIAEACKIASVPLIAHFHGFDASHYDTIRKYNKLYKALFDYGSCFIAVSNDMKNALERLGAASSKIVIIPYGIEINKFEGANPLLNELIFLAVGRFTLKKAPFETIRAFDLVQKEEQDAKLVMIGGGELFDETVRFVKQMGLEKKIFFPGICKPDEVAGFLRKAFCFVQHSVVSPNGDSEGTPNSILEASASGLPVVSTFHAGIKEAVVHGKTGFLVEEHDYTKMAEYMLLLARDRKLAYEMGKNGVEHIKENYELSKQINKIIILIQKFSKK